MPLVLVPYSTVFLKVPVMPHLSATATLSSVIILSMLFAVSIHSFQLWTNIAIQFILNENLIIEQDGVTMN
jgi:hypothetical protein